MTQAIFRSKTPEEDELDKKLAELTLLESELAQRELDLVTLKAELQAFELKYLRVVGVRIAKLDEIEAQIAEIIAKMRPEDEIVVKEARQARSQASESAQAAGAAQEHEKAREEFKPSDSLKAVYREAAKRFHPDLATGENDRVRRTQQMVAVNAAYSAGDEDALRKMLRDWEDSPDNVSGDDVGANLIRTIRKISMVNRRLAEMAAEIELLKQSDISKLRVEVQGAESKERDILQEMAEHLDAQIAAQQKRMEELFATLIKSQKGEQKHG
jgi:hypothetical protein